MKPSLSSLVVLTFACGFIPAQSQQTAPDSTKQTAPDNSKQNARHTRTADNQLDATADRHTLAQVRKAIVADKELSMYAHNVKVLVTGGKVTLKGPVNSKDEKQKIAADAATVVNADAITNNLTVK